MVTTYKIGDTFTTETGIWKVLDVGQRTLLAIKNGCVVWDELLPYALVFTLDEVE